MSIKKQKIELGGEKNINDIRIRDKYILIIKIKVERE